MTDQSKVLDPKQFPKKKPNKYGRLTGMLNGAFAVEVAKSRGVSGEDEVSKYDGYGWREDQHPRADDGKFGQGSGSSGGVSGEDEQQPGSGGVGGKIGVGGVSGMDEPQPGSGGVGGDLREAVQPPDPGGVTGEKPADENKRPGQGLMTPAEAMQDKHTAEAWAEVPDKDLEYMANDKTDPHIQTIAKMEQRRRGESGVETEQDTPPPPGESYAPDFTHPDPKTGVTPAARVGVPAFEVPPPPPLKPLPNLTPHERAVESSFNDAFNKNPDKMTNDYLSGVLSTAKTEGKPPKFETDEAKQLNHDWQDVPLEQRMVNRATLNTPLHQAANAITKRAFVKHLDTLRPGSHVAVTVGGCGAGKGFTMKNVDAAKAISANAEAVWDSAGDQNATENPWIQSELEKRGLVGDYIFVQADPKNSWANPKFGVIKRADDREDGRMVDADVFADSYAIGAKNHHAFHQHNKNNPNANFTFLLGGVPPDQMRELPGVPEEAMSIDRDELAGFAKQTVAEREGIPAHIKRGALMGSRIWGHQGHGDPPA